MRRILKNPLICASILVIVALAALFAEVKLRIYLKDGSLQTGNLVKETDDEFVILAQSGRKEIPKKDIMFVNGKTLLQWKAKPDKFFQTEIIPDELPDNDFVNDLSVDSPALSKKPPKIEPAAPLKPTPLLTQEEPEPNMTTKNQEPVLTPVQSQPKTVQRKPPGVIAHEKASTPVVKKKKPKPAVVANKKKQSSKPKVVKKQKTNTNKMASQKVNRPRKFTRTSTGNYHYKKALKHLEKKQRGQAVQELHYATVLDRRNKEAALLLGKMYMEDEVYGRAKKLFNHPGLKKNDDAIGYIEQIDQNIKQTTKARNIFLAATTAGGLSIIPILFLYRRYLKPRVKEPIEAPVQEEVIAEDIEVSSMGREVEEVLAQLDVKEPVKSVVAEPKEDRGFKPPPPPVKREIPKPIEPVKQTEPEKPKPPVEPAKKDIIEFPVPLAEQSSLQEQQEKLLKFSNKVREAVQNGHSNVEKGEIESARREYKTALALDPVSIDAYLGLGYLHFMAEQWELAHQHYAKALEIDPNNADAHYGVGRVLLEHHDLEGGVAELQKTVDLDPTFEDARETLSILGKAA